MPNASGNNFALIIFLIVLAAIFVTVLIVAGIGLMHRRQRGRTLTNSARYDDSSAPRFENYQAQDSSDTLQDINPLRTVDRARSSTTSSSKRSAHSDKQDGYR
jgi:hypothetical protein